AQVGVFPFLDPPVRQARALIGVKRLGAGVCNSAGAGQPPPRGGEGRVRRALGIGFCQNQVHRNMLQAASSNWASPEASSSSASSLSPLFTTRPFDMTCTKSGTM